MHCPTHFLEQPHIGCFFLFFAALKFARALPLLVGVFKAIIQSADLLRYLQRMQSIVIASLRTSALTLFLSLSFPRQFFWSPLARSQAILLPHFMFTFIFSHCTRCYCCCCRRRRQHPRQVHFAASPTLL